MTHTIKSLREEKEQCLTEIQNHLTTIQSIDEMITNAIKAQFPHKKLIGLDYLYTRAKWCMSEPRTGKLNETSFGNFDTNYLQYNRIMTGKDVTTMLTVDAQADMGKTTINPTDTYLLMSLDDWEPEDENTEASTLSYNLTDPLIEEFLFINISSLDKIEF
jgi:hypothetical protein